ncbi:cyclin-dependent kinase g-1 [Ophiostoma piceae UAMH 11346]|uniref:Cyclin-dependent kinase g-1 n=1 Tax=Ophiostoma piceae (strain UAMH 11346) TaxID=1262450 RepID=S3CAM7_OPHP1|nr:cyclin-dependent kinase g-1 [Ophiostoma piceae UAMH 11346]
MATLATSQQWLNQSSLLLEARPETTRITCRYSVKPKAPRRVKKSESAEAKAATPAPAAAVGQNPRALLVLKTVDTSSGVCLKYKTNKAAEVSRLFSV